MNSSSISLIFLLALAPAVFSNLVFAKDPAVFQKMKLDVLDQAAPDLKLTGDGGRTLRISELHGKPVILHFWASWCASCVLELPLLAKLAENGTASGTRFLPVSVDSPEDLGRARALLVKAGKDLPLWLITNPKEAKSYWAWGLPITYFVDSRGRILSRAIGPRDWSKIRAADLESIFQNK